jgi:trk system potassium uptake protein TrkA
MRVLIIGAGQVGSTIVEALHDERFLTVVDLDQSRLNALAHQYDVATVHGNGVSRRTLLEAGIEETSLLIACTSRDEVNIVAAIFAKKLSPPTRTIVRVSNVEYLDFWRNRQLEADFVVSSELEAAHTISRLIGVPAARQTDVFADGQVQIVEFDIPADIGRGEVVGPLLKDARLPRDSKVAAIIRDGRMIIPRGDATILPGDRIVVIGSPQAAREWSRLLGRGERRVRDVVIYGGGRIGLVTATVLLEQGIGVRIVEAQAARAREIAEQLPQARVYHAVGTDPEFIERERIGAAQAAVFAMREDAKNLYAATLAKLNGVGFTIAVVHDAVSMEVFEKAGIDVAINPRQVTAEEIVRFARDPRVQQVAMLEGDRYEILDITCREDSGLVGKRFRDLPMTGSLIGAIVRNGKAIFPRGDDVLQAGDRAIIFTESKRVQEVERVL